MSLVAGRQDSPAMRQIVVHLHGMIMHPAVILDFRGELQFGTKLSPCCLCLAEVPVEVCEIFLCNVAP